MQHLQPNTTLQGGKYRIERVLGQGGFGITYLATKTKENRQVAIKELYLNGINERHDKAVEISNPVNGGLFEKQKEKFKKEAKRLMSLDNEHIVKVYDMFEENDTAYYVMDYLNGESLSSKMKREGHPLSESEVMDVLPQLLDALSAIHSMQIWHLDIKPANIMLVNNKVVLIDFGASKQITPSEMTSTALYFTPGYAPAEQTGMLFNQFGPWTDLYAVGATLFNLLTSKSPLEFDIEEFKEDDLPDNNLGLMYKLINWMMQPKRKERPQKAVDVKQKYYIDLVSIGVLSICKEVLNKDIVKTKGEDIDFVKDLGATKSQIEEIQKEIKELFGVETEGFPMTHDFIVVSILQQLGWLFDISDEDSEESTDEEIEEYENLLEEQNKILEGRDEDTILDSQNGELDPVQNGEIDELERKALKGWAGAQIDLGYYYQTEVNDWTKAFYWYEKAAKQGHPIALSNLGWCYQNGLGVQQDYTTAFQCYKKAADKGNVSAINSIGFFYDRGYGVAQNFVLAVENYRKAAELGDAYAQNNLGICYQNGRGVEINYEEAIKWYTKDAEQGHEEAQNNLAGLRKNIEANINNTRNVDFFEDCLNPAATIGAIILLVYQIVAAFAGWPTFSTKEGLFVEENFIPALVGLVPTIVLTFWFYNEDGF